MTHSLLPVLSITASAIAVLLATQSVIHHDPPAPAELPKTRIEHPSGQIIAEVAETPDAQVKGLMYRQSLPDDHGMLFIYPKADIHCFWMKNTPLPLTVAFLADDGHILQVEDMTPHTRNPHCPAQPIRHALEMPQGWFERNHLEVGDRLGLPD